MLCFYFVYKNMKKSFLFGILAVLLAGFWFGGISLAECTESSVAKLWEECYDTLQGAFDAATDENHLVILQKDIVWDEISNYGWNKIWLDSDIPASNEFILDLSWHSIESTTKFAINVVGKKLIVRDSSDGESWIIHSTADQVVNLSEWSSLELEGWTISTDGDYAVVVFDDSWIYVKWWVLLAVWPAISWNWSWCPNGECIYWDTDMKVSWWTVRSTADYAIYHPATAKLTVEGDDTYIEWWAWAVVMNCGELEVNGWRLKSLWNDMAWQVVSNWTAWHKASVIDVLSLYCATTTTISWWNFVAENSAPIIWTWEGAEYNTSERSHWYTMSIAWWIFSPVAPDVSYIKEWYYAKDMGDGSYEITEIQTIDTISLSGSATISLWDDLNLLEVENVEDPTTVWYGYSSYLPVKWVEDAWTEVNTTDEPSAVAWTNYWLKVNLNIEDKFQLSTNPTLTYNGEAWTTSGHTTFDLENKAIFIDLWTVTAGEPLPDVEELLVPSSWTTASAWGIDDIPLDNAEATTGFDADDYAWVTTPQIIIQQKTDNAALQEEWTTESALEKDLTSDFVTDKGKVAEMQGILDVKLYYLDWSGNSTLLSGVQFSSPVKIMIPVSASVSAVEVRADHWDGYGTTWLTLDSTAWCNGWVPTVNAYTWWDVPVVNGRAEIYTCLASSFIAYTETDKPAPSNGGSSWWSRGWGGSSNSEKFTGSQTWSQVDSSTELHNDNNSQNTQDSLIETEDLQKVLDDGYTVESHKAYEFAFKNGITTMPSIWEADMESPLNRIAMAKMLSYYAINVLWQKPDTSREVPNFSDVDEKLNSDYGDAVTLAYQLGIMWINMPDNKFRPFDTVTRAEFATALSRMLYWIADGKWLYYEPHIKKLFDQWIITVTNPDMQELRGYVMIMLMRSAENK